MMWIGMAPAFRGAGSGMAERYSGVSMPKRSTGVMSRSWIGGRMKTPMRRGEGVDMIVWVGMEFWDIGKVILRERWSVRY